MDLRRLPRRRSRRPPRHLPRTSVGLVLAALSLPMLLASGTARATGADAPGNAQLNAARSLFIEAEKDEDAQRWSDALEKLQRVALVKATSGVRYHVALCEEHLGHLIAAAADYKLAAGQARTENAADVLRLVDKRILDTTDRIPHVVVTIAPAVADADVRLDGGPLAPGAAVPADPGAHTIEARAPGRIPWSSTVFVLEHDTASVEVRLEPLPPAPVAARLAPLVVAPSEVATRAPSSATDRAVARDRSVAIAAAAGAVVFGAGGVAAYLIAGNRLNGSMSDCAQIVSTDADACTSGKNAVRTWDWIGVGAWAVAAGAGTVSVLSLLRLHRDANLDGGGASPASASARLLLGPGSIALDGSF